MPADTASRLGKALAKAADDISQLDAASAKIGATVEKLAGRLVPQRSGALAKSIRFRVAKPTRKLNARVIVSAGSVRVPYAAPIHWGWKRRNIRPALYLLDATDRAEKSGVIEDTYIEAVFDILTKAIGRK